jgi:predicted nucleic acid-binding protein
MVNRVLDTSVVAKWFFQEEGTDRALEYLRELLEGRSRIHVPSSLFYELANVFWTRRSATFTEREARSVWAELTAFPLSVTDENTLLPEALILAFEQDITAYDAAFVALARQLECDLVTADDVLCPKVADECSWVKRL